MGASGGKGKEVKGRGGKGDDDGKGGASRNGSTPFVRSKGGKPPPPSHAKAASGAAADDASQKSARGGATPRASPRRGAPGGGSTPRGGARKAAAAKPKDAKEKEKEVAGRPATPDGEAAKAWQRGQQFAALAWGFQVGRHGSGGGNSLH